MADTYKNRNLTWFQKQNHTSVKKSELSKTYLLDNGVNRLVSLGHTISGDTDEDEG